MGQFCSCHKSNSENPVRLTDTQNEEVDWESAQGHVEVGGEVTFQQLCRLARETNAIRCGSTNNPNRRKNEYSHNGYKGTMYYSSTLNMKKDENTLLGLKNWRENTQAKSNVHSEQGYVYIIIGERV